MGCTPHWTVRCPTKCICLGFRSVPCHNAHVVVLGCRHQCIRFASRRSLTSLRQVAYEISDFLTIMLMILQWYVHSHVRTTGGCTGFDVYGLLVVVSWCTGAELLPRCDYELKHLGLQAFGPLMAPASSLLTGLLLPAVGGFPVPAGLAARSLSWPRRSPVCMVQLLRWCCLVCYSFTCFGTSVVVQSPLVDAEVRSGVVAVDLYNLVGFR